MPKGLRLLLFLGLAGMWVLGKAPSAEAQSWSNGYVFRRAITIDHTKVPNTDQTNFPVLISGTYPYLATTLNGGSVTSSSGFDILFSSDPDGTNLLPFEQESYSASTGAINYWVNIPTLSHTADTVIYMFYGNGSVTTDQSNKTAVWNANYKGVWHLGNGTVLNASDSTTNANNGTVNGSISAAVGKIGGAASAPGGTNNAISATNSVTPDTSPFTYSCWVNSSGGGTAIYRGQDGFGNGWSANLGAGSRFTFYIVNTVPAQISLTSNTTVTAGTWYNLVAVWTPSSGMKLYVNGVLDSSNTDVSTALRSSTKGLQFLMAGSGSFSGLLDEVEVSNTARSGDWIATQYNNQGSPATFYSISAAVVNGSSGSSPYIAGLWPTIGPVTTPVQILGAKFGASQGSSAVTFNGTTGAPLAWNDSAIYVRVPTGASTGNVSVTVGGASSNGIGFTVNTAPGVASIYPQSGLAGTQVLITGANFGATQQSSLVSLNGMNVPILSWSDTSLLVVVPSGASSGPFVVTVGAQTGTSSVFTVSPVPTGWLQQDVGAVGAAGGGTFQNAGFTVSGAGQGILSSADGMHFVYQPLSGDGSIIARVVSMPGGTTYEQAGVMIRETLNAGSASVCAAYQVNQVKLFVRSTTGGNSSSVASSGNLSLPYWVKLVRSGNSFTGYYSQDGMNWVQDGSSQTINMAQSVYVGLAVSSDIASTSATALFDYVSVSSNSILVPVINTLSATTGSVGSQVTLNGLNFGASQGNNQVFLNGAPTTISAWSATSITITIPAGATSGYLVVSLGPSMNDSNPVQFEVTTQPLPQGVLDRDIGAVGSVGSATYSNGLFDVVSGGSVGSTSDKFHFIYQSLSGDGSIVAQVAYIGSGNYPQSGVMIRETLDSGSANAFLFYQPNQAFMYSRASAGAGTTQQTVGISGFLNGSYPYWVKLTRSGNSFSGYVSMDGVYWTQIGTSLSITMAQNVYIGLATSANNGSTREAKFDNVSFGSAASPAPTITNTSATTGAIGNQITISGSGFGAAQGTGTVYLNDAPITINSWSATSITATIPASATTGYLGVAVGPSLNGSNAVWFGVTSQPLPSGWLDRDMGRPGTIYPTGSATYSNGTVTINAAGYGLENGNTSDAMHLVYQTLVGDGSIVARVSNKTTNYAGVLMRETLDPGSRDVLVNYSPTQAYLYTRSTTGAAVTSQPTGFSFPAYPYWVRMTRSGNSFSGYASSDGVYWTQVGTTQTIQMPQTVYVALAAAWSANGSLRLAAFDNVSLQTGAVPAAPVVTSASPTVVGPGYSVTIVGSGFGATQGSSQAYFNGAAASAITSWSDTQIVATVPSTATSGPVTAVVNGLGSNRTVSVTVYKPTINSLTPPAASTGGTITIAGSGFGSTQGSSVVKFNGVSASISSWSDTSITAVVPTSATSGPVTVTEGGVVSNSVQFTVLEPLAVTGISPATGPVGTTVTVSGAGFGPTQSNSTVDFYGTVATVASWSDTQITVAVPVGAPSGSINVTVAGTVFYGPNFTVTWTVGLTDSLGNSTSYTSALIGGAWVPTNSQGSGCSSCSLRGTIQNTYDTAGNVLTRTDELGRTTTYTYNSNNNLTSVSVPTGSGNATTSYTYNSFGEVLTTTDPLGNVTTNTYDTKGNLTKVTTPVPSPGVPASATQFGYDTKGELTTITDPLNNVTTLTHNAAGLIATITDAQNNVTTYGYDTHGNRTSVTDALNHQTTFAYDAGDRLTTITYPDTTTTTFSYDYRGRRTSVTDQNGKITTYAYDDADRLLTVTDAANNVTTYGYDTESNLTSIKDANNHTTTFAYDAFGRVTQTTFPSGAFETYSYDAVGNLTGKTDRKNQLVTYTYDQLNRLAQKTYPDNATVNYTYDNDSRLTQVSDPTGTYTFTFDNMGRLTGTTTSYSFLTSRTFTTSYAYDAASNRIGFSDPESGSTTYAYDTLNRLQALTPPAAISGGSFGFGYDALSRRTSLTRPNAVNTTYGYDNLSRLLSVTHAKGGTTIDGAEYTVDNAGNRTSKTDQRTAVTTNYGYDAIYQLLSATPSGGTAESYTYDPVGNRLSSAGVPSYSYNSSNELTSSSVATYGYDLNGNTTSKTDSTGTTNYAWDFENRLTSVTLPGSGGTVSFKYDPFGRRIYKSSSSGTSVFAYDRDNLIEETNGSGTVVARYSQGENSDEPLAMLRSGATSFYQADGLGSVTSLSNGAGTLAQTYTFDSFGKQTASSGSLTNPFQYTARESDADTGLYYYRARYYDQNAGRFLSEDPLKFGGDGTNFYAYAGNDPVANSDPTGCGFIDCVKALAELKDALDKLHEREAENAAAGKCDPGHDKAIEQAKNRVRNALAKARTCLSLEDFKRIWDSLKSLAEDVGTKIWNWLNNDPRQNWPSIYGPMPGQPRVYPPLPIPIPVPVPVVP